MLQAGDRGEPKQAHFLSLWDSESSGGKTGLIQNHTRNENRAAVSSATGGGAQENGGLQRGSDGAQEVGRDFPEGTILEWRFVAQVGAGISRRGKGELPGRLKDLCKCPG